MPDTNNKRLIEVDFPLKEVSEESAKEKNIRHGNISSLHVWWARKPMAASRATTFAALIRSPNTESELKEYLDFISKLAKWENSLDPRLIKKARGIIRNNFNGAKPRVLDPFAGGGSIPLEALRLGCETYALELNPVAVSILKAVIEYPQKYGNKEGFVSDGFSLSQSKRGNPLIDDIKRWGDFVLQEAIKEIGCFYPEEKDGSIPVAYVWARTIRCQNPSCGTEIPLLHQLWLAIKKNDGVALRMIVNQQKKEIKFAIATGKEIDFDPSEGTTRQASVLCPVCGGGIDDVSVRKEARDGRLGEKLLVIISVNPNKHGKNYRIATEIDSNIFRNAASSLDNKIKTWKRNFNPVPDEPLPPIGTLGFRVQRYGIIKWGDLFNPRQKLALITFLDKIRLAYDKMISEGFESEYAKAITLFLALGLDRIASYGSSFCVLNPTGGRGVKNIFERQALIMVWHYVESNPFNTIAAGWPTAIRKNVAWLEHASKAFLFAGKVEQGTATRLPWSDNYFDAIITDPPYYDNVPYSDLSDFFYVWLKRALGDIYPELFSTPLTPKSQEIIQDPVRHGNDVEKAKKFFEDMITQSFKEIHRVLKTDGIAIIVFAYKSTEAWETIISGLLKSGLVLTASWPIHTERAGRLRAQESAALASSIYMVCRKRSEERTAYFNEIREKIEERIKEKLTQFWEQGISGADFFVSAIGPAVEVFGKYSRVEKLTGEQVSVQELLEYVRKVVSEFALERVLKRSDLGSIDAETRFYLLWRWTFKNAKVPFDDAIKLSRPMGVELTDMWGSGSLVRKEKEFIRVLDPVERSEDPTFLKKRRLTSIIEALHYALALWERGEREQIKSILIESGYAGNEMFWQTAQAISEVLPKGDKEKQLLQGFLYGKETYYKGDIKGKRSLLDFMEGAR